MLKKSLQIEEKLYQIEIWINSNEGRETEMMTTRVSIHLFLITQVSLR